MSRALAVCVLGLAVSGLGCLSPAQNRQDSLVRIAHEYNDGLRWGRYDQVTPHLASDAAARFLARSGDLAEEFEMADVDIAAIAFKDEGRLADVTVDFTWYSRRRALVGRSLVAQTWRYDAGKWICATQKRLRGDRFPLVAD